MSLAAKWLERARWPRRIKPFGKLAMRHDPEGKPFVTVHFELAFDAATRMWDHWIQRIDHPAVIPAFEPGLLRFTAIDWDRRGTQLVTADAERKIATHGLELVSAIQHVVEVVGIADAKWFTNPILKLDLQGRLRIAFAAPVAPISDRSDQGLLVLAVGRGLDQLVARRAHGSACGQIIARCLELDRDTFKTLRSVTKALRVADGSRPRLEPPTELWKALERAIGLWTFRDRPSALDCLEPWASDPIAAELRELIATAPLVDLETVPSDYDRSMYMRPEPIIEDRASRVPVPRVFQHVYERLHPPQVVRSIEPAPPVGTPHEQVEDLLHRRRYHDALDKVDSIVASAPDEPRAHHLRGKALLALGRLPDARGAFDRACTLQPKLLEAMLLRREVDRVMAATRAAAAVPNPMVSSLPEHLAELRDVMISGRIVDAIQMLKRPVYDDDTVAQLLLADLLIRDERYDDSLTVLAPLTADESHELRSRALAALGRDEEAGVEMSTYLRLIEQRSDRRIESM